MVSSIAMKYKQFNLTSVICLHTVKCKNRPILSIEWILRGAATPGQSRPGSNGNEEHFIFFKAPGLEPHHLMQFCVIPGHSLGMGPYPSAEMQ